MIEQAMPHDDVQREADAHAPTEAVEDHERAMQDGPSPAPASMKIRRISAELAGDLAVEADLISTMLRLDEKGRSKVERDTLLVELGIQALNVVIEQWRKETGRKFPDHEDLRRYLMGWSR